VGELCKRESNKGRRKIRNWGESHQPGGKRERKKPPGKKTSYRGIRRESPTAPRKRRGISEKNACSRRGDQTSLNNKSPARIMIWQRNFATQKRKGQGKGDQHLHPKKMENWIQRKGLLTTTPNTEEKGKFTTTPPTTEKAISRPSLKNPQGKKASVQYARSPKIEIQKKARKRGGSRQKQDKKRLGGLFGGR